MMTRNKKILAFVLFAICLFSFSATLFAQEGTQAPESVVYKLYESRNNNEFDKFLSCFYYADYLTDADKETLKTTFYSPRFSYTLQPNQVIMQDANNATFNYVEINTVKTNIGNAIIKWDVTAKLINGEEGWQILELIYGKSELIRPVKK